MSTPERDDDAAAGAGGGERHHRRQSDVDAAWADIVARWEDEVPGRPAGPASAGPVPADPPPAWSAPAGAAPADPAPHAAPAARAPAPQPSGPRDHALAEEADAQGYVPPEPPPLSTGGWSSWLPWAGVLGGPLLLVLAAVVYRSVPGVLLAVAVTAFVTGAALLVLRLPTRRPDDEDDGAVV